MWAAAPLGMLAVMASAFGPEGMTLCVGQAALSVLMLEAANYVQHYGLQRTKLDDGRSVSCRCNNRLAASVTEPSVGTCGVALIFDSRSLLLGITCLPPLMTCCSSSLHAVLTILCCLLL